MDNRKEHYNKKGMYAGYDKNHKERQAEDYYSTPTEEVTNILKTIELDLNDSTILEPCAGGGHMVAGVMKYLSDSDIKHWSLYATDIKDRGNVSSIEINTGNEFDFLSDNYPIKDVDYIIMNPPFSIIEPFVMKSLGIANKGVLMFGRLQFLESEKRFNNILKDNPPSDFWVYVDRVACFKNGDLTIKPDSIQAYAWFYWDLTKPAVETKCHWIRRVGK